MIDETHPDGGGPRYYGVYPALVTDLVDPWSLGRIEVELPWLGDEGRDVRAWATLLSPYADKDQGFQALPEVGSQVVVAFEAGDLRRPYIVGACWNGLETPPEAATRANDKRLLQTRSGSRLEFDDAAAGARVTLSTPSGHTLELDDQGSNITVTHSNGTVITLTAAGKVEITANATVDVTASAMNVHAAVATFDGVINCTTLIAKSSVVSPAYTPGAGNVW